MVEYNFFSFTKIHASSTKKKMMKIYYDFSSFDDEDYEEMDK